MAVLIHALCIVAILSSGAAQHDTDGNDDEFTNIDWLLDAVHHRLELNTYEYQIKIPCKYGLDRPKLIPALEYEVFDLSRGYITLSEPITSIVNLTKLRLPGNEKLPGVLSLRHRYYDIRSGPSHAQSFGKVDLKTGSWEDGDADYFVPSYSARSRSVTKVEEDIHKCYSEVSRSCKVYGVKHPPATLREAYSLFPKLSQALDFRSADTELLAVEQYSWSTMYWGELNGYTYKVEVDFLYGSHEEAVHGSPNCLKSEWSIRLFAGADSKEHAPSIDDDTKAIVGKLHQGLLESQFSEDPDCGLSLWVLTVGISVPLVVLATLLLSALAYYKYYTQAGSTWARLEQTNEHGIMEDATMQRGENTVPEDATWDEEDARSHSVDTGA